LPFINAVLDFPWPLQEYERWLSQRPAADSDDYLYSQSRVRLTPHDDDQLATPNSVSVEHAGNSVFVRIAGQSAPIAIPNITRHDAESIIAALRARPSVIELPFVSSVPANVCDLMLGVGFGRFIFAPTALESLERQSSAAEIVRFPGSPYEIARNYWINVGSLNHAIEHSIATSQSSSSFVDWLRTLHLQLLLGADLQTFYCPSSPVAQRRVAPGALYVHTTHTLSSSLGEFILDGPRINASAVGGEQYNRLIDRSLGLQLVESESRTFSESTTGWGRLVNARARAEAQERRWYLPPRPIGEGHWEALFSAWNRTVDAMEKQDLAGGVGHLGHFHWYFVHLHPFACANQSLAFAIVNWVLNRLTGSGIPHLVLDHLALRHECTEYSRLFARAVSNWTTAEVEPAVRHLARVRSRQVLDDFIAQLAATTSESDADALAHRNPASARLALLVDGASLSPAINP
jgi:hypothetical protein